MYMLQNIHVIEVRYNTHIIYRYGVRAALVLHPQLFAQVDVWYIYIDIYLYSIHPVVIIHNPRLDVRMQAHSCCIVYSECLRYFCENCHTIYSFGLWHKMRARWNDIVSGPSPAPQKRIYIMSLFKFTCFICLMTARLSMEFAIFIRKNGWKSSAPLLRVSQSSRVVVFKELPRRLSAHLEQVEAEELLTSIRRCLDTLKVEHKIMTCSLLAITIKPETNATSFRVRHFFFLRFLFDALSP